MPLPLENHWWDAHLPLVSMMTVNAGASLGQEVGGRSDGRPRGRRVRVRPQPAVPSLRAEIISHSQTEHHYYWLISAGRDECPVVLYVA